VTGLDYKKAREHRILCRGERGELGRANASSDSWATGSGVGLVRMNHGFFFFCVGPCFYIGFFI
jgi:hypothetical protein